MPLKIAITGGIGSGKSLVSKCLKELGFPVFSCDEIYKSVIITPEYVQKIKENFPKCVQNDVIDRALLADEVFDNPSKLDTLNGIAHPLIMKNLFDSMDKATGELVFAEVPLLFEGNYEKSFDYVIVVQRDLRKRIEGVVNRDSITERAIEKRIQAQFDYSQLKKHESTNIYILDNNGTVEELKNKLKNWIFALKNN